jgi:hypothetical protein
MAGFKRKVFYVGGFDPRGPRFYHALGAEQIERWNLRMEEAATLSTRRNVSDTRVDWTIANPGRAVETDYSFLRWDDLVRANWIGNPFTLAWRAFRAYRDNIRNLDFATGKRLGKGQLITLFYPALFTLLFPLAFGLPVALVLAIWLPWLFALPIGLIAGIFLARPLLVKMHAPWLLRFFVFNSELGGSGADPALNARLDAFADEIEAALDQGWDEVVLLTHSNGSILCVPLLARLLRRRGGALPANFTFMTMGHCIPLVACRRDATAFKEELAYLASQDFRWIDIGSPPDGAAYSGVNPMLLVAPDPRPRMELLSPRFHLFYDPETYHKGYANKYEIHFDYLRTGDRVSEIDWPSLMATERTASQAVADFRANH